MFALIFFLLLAVVVLLAAAGRIWVDSTPSNLPSINMAANSHGDPVSLRHAEGQRRTA
jgi:cytochrome oxidase Cu insertion factor (SCO1/SenC/PrrC family)